VPLTELLLQDVAKTVSFLASDDSEFITGQTVRTLKVASLQDLTFACSDRVRWWNSVLLMILFYCEGNDDATISSIGYEQLYYNVQSHANFLLNMNTIECSSVKCDYWPQRAPPVAFSVY